MFRFLLLARTDIRESSRVVVNMRILSITDKTYALPVPYRAPQRTLNYYENYDISLLICKAFIAAKLCTSTAVELYMRFASSFAVIFLKRVNELDLLNLYIKSSFRFQLIYAVFKY
jgi:hypothetical protein